MARGVAIRHSQREADRLPYFVFRLVKYSAECSSRVNQGLNAADVAQHRHFQEKGGRGLYHTCILFACRPWLCDENDKLTLTFLSATCRVVAYVRAKFARRTTSHTPFPPPAYPTRRVCLINSKTAGRVGWACLICLMVAHTTTVNYWAGCVARDSPRTRRKRCTKPHLEIWHSKATKIFHPVKV